MNQFIENKNYLQNIESNLRTFGGGSQRQLSRSQKTLKSRPCVLQIHETNILNSKYKLNNKMIKIVDNYTLTEYLGKGEYGKVYKAFNIDTKIDVAIKMIPLTKFEELSKLIELTKNQIQILKLLQDNINVIKFVEMIKTNRYIYLIYQYCQGGTLEDYIRTRGHLPQKQALRIFKQLINAFKSMHQNHILHRDIKPNNIFFKSGHLKLADFGFCKKLKNFDDLTQTSLGSPLYMAPQVLNGDVYDSRADVWSVGIVLYEMLFGKCPFGDCNIKQLINIYSADKLRMPMATENIFISPSTQNMLRRMLEKDQLKRISWQDFFYEYQIDEYGTIKKKQKDFQYDLMKLMKKNSSIQSQPTPTPKKPSSSLKFDWSKITQKNSSVHSQELNYKPKSIEGNIDEILNLKKRVKQLQTEYEKRLQLSAIIEQMLNSTVNHHYSSSICYFLVYNLQHLIANGLPEVQTLLTQNKQLLLKSPNQSNILNKMVVVFRNQAETLALRLNSLKMSLLIDQQFPKSAAKYPQKSVLSAQVAKYIRNFEVKTPGITDLLFKDSSPQKRNQLTFLLRVLWGVSLIKKQPKSKQLISISIKPQTPVKQISKLLNKMIVFIN